MEKAGEGYSFFVVYGRTHMQLDYNSIEVPEVVHRKHGYDELNEVIRRDLGRRIVVVGACIGTDSHTTGIDAIMNMKGFAGDYGLERYPMFRAVNLGSQVDPEHLVQRAKEENADAVLVSKVVTQRDVHKEDARALIDAAKQQGVFEKTIFLFGGPRVDHKTALELGFDAGFGPGTRPSDVANYIYYRLLERMGRAPHRRPPMVRRTPRSRRPARSWERRCEGDAQGQALRARRALRWRVGRWRARARPLRRRRHRAAHPQRRR